MLYLSDPSEFVHRNDTGDHEKAIDSYKPITVDFFPLLLQSKHS